MRRLSLFAILAVSIGCAPKQPDEPKEPAAQPQAQAQAQSPAPANQGGVTPIAPGAGAGPMTPVAGTENVQGSGGGSVSMAAKEMAKKSAANQQNQQVPADESE